MNPKTYKDPWTAAHYGTYWVAARLLARVAHEKELAKKAGKRKATKTPAPTTAGTANATAPAMKKTKTAGEEASPPRKMTNAELKLKALQLIQRIHAVEGVPEGIVYDTCPQVVAKIKEFLQRDGMTKASVLQALGDINNGSMNKFLSGKKQDQCGNVTYRTAYVFFEKLRILEGKKKSAARIKNESEHPTGVRSSGKRQMLLFHYCWCHRTLKFSLSPVARVIVFFDQGKSWTNLLCMSWFWWLVDLLPHGG